MKVKGFSKKNTRSFIENHGEYRPVFSTTPSLTSSGPDGIEKTGYYYNLKESILNGEYSRTKLLKLYQDHRKDVHHSVGAMIRDGLLLLPFSNEEYRVLLGNKTLPTYLGEQREKLLGKEISALYAPLSETNQKLIKEIEDHRLEREKLEKNGGHYTYDQRVKLDDEDTRLVAAYDENKKKLLNLINDRYPHVFTKEVHNELIKLIEFRNLVQLIPERKKVMIDIDVETELTEINKNLTDLKKEIESSTGHQMKEGVANTGKKISAYIEPLANKISTYAEPLTTKAAVMKDKAITTASNVLGKHFGHFLSTPERELPPAKFEIAAIQYLTLLTDHLSKLDVKDSQAVRNFLIRVDASLRQAILKLIARAVFDFSFENSKSLKHCV